jgi:hypothetical protein
MSEPSRVPTSIYAVVISGLDCYVTSHGYILYILIYMPWRDYFSCSEIGTSPIDLAQQSWFYLMTEKDSGLRNIVL